MDCHHKNQQGEPAVYGRDLYEALEVNTRYNDWISRMFAFGFEEGTDYLLVTQKRVTNNPKNPIAQISDHLLTLDAANEIAMIQKNERGRMVRRYFIEKEKEARQLAKLPTAPMSLIKLHNEAFLQVDSRFHAIEEKQEATDQKINHLQTQTASPTLKN